MKENETIELRFEQVLKDCVNLLTEQSSQTNQQIESLVTSSKSTEASIKTLVEVSIKSEERHKQYDEKFERQEDNQKAQGKKIEHVSEAIIAISKDIERNGDRWAGLYKVLSGVITTIIGAAIVAAYVTSK